MNRVIRSQGAMNAVRLLPNNNKNSLTALKAISSSSILNINPHSSSSSSSSSLVRHFRSARERIDMYRDRETKKTDWPELVGITTEEAEKKIKEEMPGARIHVVPHDSPVTFDFQSNRVRLFVDSSQIVVRAPRIG